MTRLWQFLLARATQLGLLEDEAANVIVLGGAASETVSRDAETAQAAGKKWGTWLCDFLSWAVQPNHCAQVRNGAPMPAQAMLRAVLWLTLLLAALAAVPGGVVWLLWAGWRWALG